MRQPRCCRFWILWVGSMAIRCLAQTFAWLAVLVGILLGAGGDLAWPAAWIFAAEYAVLCGAMVAWLARHDPALLRERFAAPLHRDQALWDRIFLLAVMVGFVGWLVLMGLDARRFGWSSMPPALEVVGALLFFASIALAWLAFRANTFAVPQARVQIQRHQHVIDTGPYGYVRHPMYAGAFLFFVGLPLQLGSWLGLATAPLLMLAIATRTLGEERLLHRELAGYDAYASRVRWRIVPGVW